jgi:hypothetical protein
VKITGKGVAVSALAAVAAGFALQQLYKATGKYPPEPVFWGAVGAGAFLLTHARQSPLRLKG